MLIKCKDTKKTLYNKLIETKLSIECKIKRLQKVKAETQNCLDMSIEDYIVYEEEIKEIDKVLDNLNNTLKEVENAIEKLE